MKKTTLLLAGAAGLGLVLVAAACARQGGVESGPDAAAPDTIEGTVRQVGNTPFQRTVVKGGETSATIVGEYQEELVHAVGARVRVWGAYRDGDGDRPGRELEAAGYEILSVDGADPTVGVLHHEPGKGYYVVTEGGREVSLAGVPDGLGAKVGGKVWLVLGENGAVQRYGVLREP